VNNNDKNVLVIIIIIIIYKLEMYRIQIFQFRLEPDVAVYPSAYRARTGPDSVVADLRHVTRILY